MTFDPRQWPSASSAQWNVECPGRFLASRNLPELPRDKDDLSESGTIVHALWTGKFDPDKHRAPTPEEVDKSYALIDAEEKACTEHFRDDWPKTMRFVEQRLTLSLDNFNQPECDHKFVDSVCCLKCGWIPTLRCSGQFDVARVHTPTQRVLILDGKTGWNDVTANPRNLQLRWLAGLYYENIGAEEIAVGILKPYGKTPAPCVYSEDDLARAVQEMESQVRAMFSPNAKRIPGEAQCRYCRFRNECPERTAWLSSALPALVPALLPMTLPVSEWTPAQRTAFLDVEKGCREWIDDVKAQMKPILEKDPDAAPGYALRDGKTLETIVDAQKVFSRFIEAGGTAEQFMPAVKILKDKLKQAVRDSVGSKGKELELQIRLLIDGCTEEKKCEPSIVRVK